MGRRVSKAEDEERLRAWHSQHPGMAVHGKPWTHIHCMGSDHVSVAEDVCVTAGVFLDNNSISLQHAAICMCSLAFQYCLCYSCVQLG